METKKPWLSKTIVLNAIMGLAAAAAAFWPGASGVNTWMSANASLIAGVWAVLNIALRAITKDKIGLTE